MSGPSLTRQLLIDGTDAPATTGGGYLPSVLLDRSLARAWRTVALHFARQKQTPAGREISVDFNSTVDTLVKA